MRDWQRDALALYSKIRSEGHTSILWEATPGAGKTYAALKLCKSELKYRRSKRIIIVVPTSHLKIQWAKSAIGMGLELDHRGVENGNRLPSDCHGVVLSYQQVGFDPKRYRKLLSDSVVVLDEVHHAGDGLTWGDSLRFALSHASFVLCLSGTAFRSDNNPIPFVKYNERGVSQPDYSYTYSQAVTDRVCRPAAFFTYGGDVAWEEAGEEVRADFSDALDRVGRTRRLRAALDPESGWVEPMIRDADSMLSAVREEHVDAGGLLVAMSQRHARSMAQVLFKVTGERATVVLSDDPVAHKRIKNFTKSRDRWLVACNMVSEGVDVPRLRVGVFATTIRTKMYFRQFLGRIVRKTEVPKGVQTSFCYLPADPWLKRLAEEIEDEQRHSITAKSLDDFGEFELERQKPEKKEDTWKALQGNNSGIESVISGGGQLSLWQNMRQAESLEDEVLHVEGDDEPLTGVEIKEEIAREIRMLARHYHRKSGQPYSYIHGLLNRQQGIKSQKECSGEQLQQRLHILEKLVQKKQE